MGGKNKHRRKQQQKQANSQTHAPKLSEDEMCELVSQATDINPFLSHRYQRLKACEDYAFLLSTKWLREWKDYVGYDNLYGEGGDKKMGKRAPGHINTDIVVHSRDYFQVDEELMAEYAFLNVIVNEKYDLDDEFIAIDEEFWEKISALYPATQVKRPIRKLKKSGKVIVDSNLMAFDVVMIHYQDGLEEKISNMKNIRKNIDDVIPCKKMQFSELWELTDLEEFLARYCECFYGQKHEKIWKADNFIGALSLQEMFANNMKKETYQIYGQPLNQTFQELDLDEFLKSNQYTLIVEIGDTRLKSADLPKDIHGYCEYCIEKKPLDFACDCGTMLYCSLQCRTDDQCWHYKLCGKAFDSDDDKEYSIKAKEGSGMSGLKNLGNTCYMNSSMQLAYNIQFIRRIFLTNSWDGENEKLEQEDRMFLSKVGKLIKKVSQGEMGSVVEPWSFKGQVNYFMSAFKGYKQHDADDFLINFINLINDTLPKPSQDDVYHPIFRQCMLGTFNSLVICPECGFEIKNVEDFSQITVPIKSKQKKVIYNYGIVINPFQIIYGRAQLKDTWGLISKEVVQKNQCFMIGGTDGDEHIFQVDTTETPEKMIKKLKKDLLFFPNEKISEGDIWFNAGFITIKSVYGTSLKASYGYPFILKSQKTQTLGQFVVETIEKLEPGHQIESFKQEMIQKLSLIENQKKSDKQIEEKVQEEMKQDSQKEEQQNQMKKTEEQNQQQALQILNQLTEKLLLLLQNLGIKIYLDDQKRHKNVCFYCKKKCSFCELRPSFRTTVQDFFCGKVRQTKINIYFTEKREIVKVNKDLAGNGDSTLKDCFQLFKQPQQLDQENAWYCFQCEDMRLAFKQLQVNLFPKYLLIHLNRFKADGDKKIKNNEPIKYEEQQIFGGKKYHLEGVVIHEGSMQGGHYWAICYRKGQYYIFNDSKVHKAAKYFHKNAYLLLYQEM